MLWRGEGLGEDLDYDGWTILDTINFVDLSNLFFLLTVHTLMTM